MTLRRLERVFHCCSVCETMEDYKEGYLMVWTSYMSLAALLLGYTLRVLVTSYQLPWQRTRYTKVSSKIHQKLSFALRFETLLLYPRQFSWAILWCDNCRLSVSVCHVREQPSGALCKHVFSCMKLPK